MSSIPPGFSATNKYAKDGVGFDVMELEWPVQKSSCRPSKHRLPKEVHG